MYQGLLPAHYIDEKIFEHEQEKLLKKVPIYIGHEKMLPQVGSFLVSPQANDELIFLKNYNKIECFYNVCQHHHASILKDAGVIQSISCPFHRWNYNLEGRLIMAPKFNETHCISLNKKALFEWNGLYFIQQGLQSIPDSMRQIIDFSSFEYESTHTVNLAYNWKIFIETYLDDYHIPAIHSGLRAMVDINHLTWEYFEDFSLQSIFFHAKFKDSQNKKFNEYRKIIEKISQKIPIDKISWMLIYPTTMVETYPYMNVISTIKPISAFETVNYIDFFFNQKALDLCPELKDIAKEFYLEVAKEDDDLCISVQKGKNTLFKSQQSSVNILHSTLEEGIRYFHDYLHQQKIYPNFTTQKSSKF